jgi:hypothetical protein
MLRYQILTKSDLEALRSHAAGRADAGNAKSIPRSGLMEGASSLASLHCGQELDPQTPCAIAAFDDDRLVGRIAIVYTDLLVMENRVRCAVGQNFFVLDEYRDRAVGLSILLKAMRLGLPYIESGVSGQLRQILDSWKQFIPIDRSPIFQVGLDRKGLVQMAKWGHYAEERRDSIPLELLHKMRLVVRTWRQSRSVSAGRSRDELRALPPEAFARGFERVATAPAASVQVPWNVGLLQRAVEGKDRNRGAWILERGPSSAWLLTLYRQERVLGVDDDGRTHSVLEAHLNEIYPPVHDEATAQCFLAFAYDRAKRMGASILQVHAMTPAIDSVCRRLGLLSRMTKSVYIAPSGVDPATKACLSDPKAWWCRAFNEDQFEEAFLSRQPEQRRGE